MALIRYFSQTLDANLDRTLIPGPDSRNRLKEPTMRANDILPDQQNSLKRNGTVIRKGSVGAFLANARLWLEPDTEPDQRRRAEHDLRELLPALRALGLFELLEVRDPALRAWLDAADTDREAGHASE
tara:strand:- start:151 stop:534 length:384 start_codon:yes stop_codon:yes gene_type:complete